MPSVIDVAVSRLSARARALLVCAIISGLGGCVAHAYPGPRRPENETLLIETSGVKVREIDGQRAPRGSGFRLLPGSHSFDVLLDDEVGMGVRRFSKRTAPICFRGWAGHTYVLRPAYHGAQWWPEAVDPTETTPAASSNCSTQTQPVTAATPKADSAAPDSAAPDSADTAGSTDDAPAPPVVAAVPVTQSGDQEVPRAAARPAEAEPDSFRPRLLITAETGMVIGGTDLVTATTVDDSRTETLSSGDGLLLAVGARYTPLWIGETLGLGVTGSAGIKGWSVGGGDATASLFRYTVTASGHALYSVDKSLLMFVQGGATKDLGIDLSGPGGGTPFKSRVGFAGDLGFIYSFTDYWSVSVAVRAILLDYDVGPFHLGANGFGGTLGFNLYVL